MAKAKSKIPLNDMLLAIDTGDLYFYNNLDSDQRKDFSPWLAMRYASNVSGDYSMYYISMVNDIVNKDFSILNKHPELQWKLLAVCGIGTKQYHPFVPPGKRKKKSKIQDLLAEIYPHMKISDLEMLEEINTKTELKELATDYGYTKKEISEIFKR